MRMLLIQTSAELTKHLMPPMGLMALATYLRAQGVEASVHDLSFSGDPMEELPEYDALMAQANVPIYQDRLTDDDLLRIAKEVNDIASELSGGGSRLYLKLKGLFINLSRVRRQSDLRIVLKKIQLHVRGGA